MLLPELDYAHAVNVIAAALAFAAGSSAVTVLAL